MRVFEIYRRLGGRVDATVVTGSFPGARDERVDGVAYRRLGVRSPYALSRWSYARAATRLLEGAEYDVAVYDFSVYTPIRVPREQPVGLVVHMLHGPTAEERWGKILGRMVAGAEGRLLRRARWISTTSAWMEGQLRPLTAPEARIVRIGSGVPDEFAGVARQEEDFLLYYGRFDLFQKGLDTLLHAFGRVAAHHPRLRLVLAGRGKDVEWVRELGRELGVANRLRVITGVEREEILALFAGALMLVMPSRLEGLPMVPAEAMAAGVPVIATSVGALAEVVDPPRGGLLVPPDDPAELSAAILSLLESPERRHSLSASARESARRFSWDEVAERHLEFLHRVAGDRPSLPPSR